MTQFSPFGILAYLASNCDTPSAVTKVLTSHILLQYFWTTVLSPVSMRSPKYWHTNFLRLVNRLFNLWRTYYMPTCGHTFREPDELGQDQYHNVKANTMNSLLQDCLGTSDLAPGRYLRRLDGGNVPRRPTSGRSGHLHELHTGLINLKWISRRRTIIQDAFRWLTWLVIRFSELLSITLPDHRVPRALPD